MIKARTILNIGIVAIFVVVVGTVVMIAVRGNRMTGVARLPALGVVPNFELTEANGRPFRLVDLKERVWIASFIFTRCAEICPRMMRQETQLQGRLPKRDDLKLVTFSVDPDWDTPPVLTAYAEGFGLDRTGWVFLTGDKKQIFELAQKGFRLATQEAEPGAEMPILHSTKLVLVDRRGAIRGYYDSVDDTALESLVRDVRMLLAERT